jgi:hypothetical protein
VFSLSVVTACAAVWLYAVWQDGGVRRLLAAGLLAMSVAATLAGIAYEISRNECRNFFDPADAASRAALPPGRNADGRIGNWALPGFWPAAG